MKKKPQHEKEPNLERWLVSYADFITLLFAVFVTLFAMSVADQQKVEEVVASIRESFGYDKMAGPIAPSLVSSYDLRPIPSDVVMPTLHVPEEEEAATPPQRHAATEEFKQIKEGITNYLVAKGAQDKVNLSINRRGLIISLKEAGFFDSGSATVRPAATGLLEEIGKSISGYANALRVEGHTDNVPVSKTFPSNWELSTARATSIVHYLAGTLHFPPVRLSATGFGEYRPIADNAEESGRAKNRRVDIVLLSTEAEQVEPVRDFPPKN